MDTDIISALAGIGSGVVASSVGVFTHIRTHKLNRIANKANIMLRIIDFGEAYRSHETLEPNLQNQLRRLLYLYSGRVIDGHLAWSILRNHHEPNSLDQLAIAHQEVEAGETTGEIRFRKPQWRLDSNEFLLFIIYLMMALSWIWLRPVLSWVAGDSGDNESKFAATGILCAALLLTGFYARFCFRYIEKVRAARELAQSRRMPIRLSLRLRLNNTWCQAKRAAQRVRGLLPF